MFEIAREQRISKDERVYFRVTTEMKRILVHAAEVTGRTLTDFVASSAFNAAQKAIEDVERMHLAAEDRAVFLAGLANPLIPNDALKAAAARYRKLIG